MSKPDPIPHDPAISHLFLAFLRLGLTAFGGPAIVAFIGDMVVGKREWLSQETFKEGVAVAQTVPGATAMQTAAYVGLRVKGTAGAAAAYVGFGLPAFVLMTALSAVYAAAHHSPLSLSVFRGLQVIVVAIVAKAALTFGRTTIKRGWDLMIASGAAAYLICRGSPAAVIAAAAIIGVIVYKRPGLARDAASSTIRGSSRSALAIALVGAVLVAALLLIDRRLFELAALMIRVDLLAFGGGYASVPLMLHWVAQVNHWMTTTTFMDGIAMGQVTPGPIVITATFVGYQVAGIAGALVATLAVFLPSFVVLVLVVPRFDQVKHNALFQKAMRGVLASFVGLLVSVLVRFAVAVPWSPVSVLLGVAALVALLRNVSVPWVVLPGALLSMLLLHP